MKLNRPRIGTACHRSGLLMLCLFVATAASGADDKPPEPQPIKHRVTGLFSPDRKDDLREVLQKLPDVKLVSLDYESSEVTFEYDPAKLFTGAKPEQHFER